MANFKGASSFAILESQLTFNCTTNHYDGEPELAQHLGSLHPLRDLSEHCAVDATAESPSTSYAPTCHPETRKDVTHHIMSWIEDSSHPNATRIAWLSGPAGSGKSCIQRKVVDLCKGKGVYAASFFFSPRTPKTCCETWFVTTLAHQLTQTIPGLKPFMAAAVGNDETIFKKSLEVQIDKLIFDPLVRMKAQSMPNVIVVDGLDECVEEKEQAHILRLVQRLAGHEHFPFCVLIASRPGHIIQTAFHSFPCCRILRLEDYDADSDIRQFLKAEFSRLKSIHPCRAIIPPDWPLGKVIDILVKQASGQFLYASIVIQYLENTWRSPLVELEKIFDYVVDQQTFRDKSQSELGGMLEDVRAKRAIREKLKDRLELMVKEIVAQRNVPNESVIELEELVGRLRDSQGESRQRAEGQTKTKSVARMGLKEEGKLKEESQNFKVEVEGILKDIRTQRYPRRVSIVRLKKSMVGLKRSMVESEKSMRELENVLKVPPATDAFIELDALYSKILEPPKAHSVDTLLGLKPGSTDIILCNWHSIVSTSVLHGSGTSITFHHHSVKDFLLSKSRCGDLYQDEVETKLYLTSRYVELSTKQKPNTAEYFNYPLSTIMQATSVHWDERFFQDQLIRDSLPQFIEDFFMDVSSNITQEPDTKGKWVSTLKLMHETTCLFSELYHQHLCKNQRECLRFCERLWRITHLGDEIIALAEYFELSALERREMFKRLLDAPEEAEMFDRFFDASEGEEFEDLKIVQVQVESPPDVHRHSSIQLAGFSPSLRLLGILIVPILYIVVVLTYPYLRQTVSRYNYD
ncbi:hypothetical protein H1R20_g14612, partial [Candolleomyces eurysporus]